MARNSYKLPGISETQINVSRVALDAQSPLNHNEPHMHHECEIYVNLCGEVSFAVEDRIYPVRRGSVIITRPYEFHHCIYRANKLHEHFWITFSMEEDTEYLRLFYDREKGRGNLIELEENALIQLCDVLQQMQLQESTPLKQRIAFLRMLDILESGRFAEASENIPGLPPDVQAAMHLMDEMLGQEIDILSLAEAANVSINTLERHFKASMGCSPGVILRRKRLMASLEHLKNGASVSETAARCGFSDYSNYIQLFRKNFGMTPLQYKKLF